MDGRDLVSAFYHPWVPTSKFVDEVAASLHEVVAAAREVPVEHQPERLRNALTMLVWLEVASSATTTLPAAEQTG